jgi:hypothetical protein
MNTNQQSEELSPSSDASLHEQEREAKRIAIRENAKHVLRESGLAGMLQEINRNLLKGRGRFEE